MEAKAARGDKAAASHKGEHQNIARATAVLDVIAQSSNAGLRLKDIIDQTGLNNAAVFRVLNGLVAYGLAEQDPATGRFVLGMRPYTWVKRAAARYRLEHIARDSVEALARETGDTIYLSVRSGNQLVCVDRQEGAFPIKTLTLEVGARRPLGVSAGGMALLAFLDDREIEEILRAHREDDIEFPSDENNLWERVHAARAAGFVYYDASVIRGSEVVDGVTALALPIRRSDGTPGAAVSVAALTQRLQEPRQSKILEVMRAEVKKIEMRISEPIT